MTRKAKPKVKAPGSKNRLDYDEKVKLPDEDPEDVIRALLDVPRDQATNGEADDSDDSR